MAITYKWSINQMNAHIEAEGEQNVIFTVHWTYSGSEEISGETYQASSIGAQGFTYVAGEPFVPYADTEAFESVVIGWLEAVLDKVSKLQGVTFDWKKSDSILDIKKDIGFIAQDVQKVVPELVRKSEGGMLSMRHQGIAPILLEAIKELKAEIDLLKSKPCTCNKCNCNE